MKALFTAAALISILLPSCVSMEGPPSFDASFQAASQYNFRGVARNAKSVVQMDGVVGLTSADGGVFSGGFWGNLDVSDNTGKSSFPDGNGKEFSEIDFTGTYARTFGNYSLAFGLISYNFPNLVGRSTTELFASGTYDAHHLSPTFTIFKDIEETDGYYMTAGIRKGRDLSASFRWDAGLSLGFMSGDQSDTYYGDGTGTGFSDLTGSVTLSHRYSDYITLYATLAGSTVIDGDFKDSLDRVRIDENNIWGAVGIGWSY